MEKKSNNFRLSISLLKIGNTIVSRTTSVCSVNVVLFDVSCKLISCK